ncbi:MAG TPA: hypothetical protein VFL63_08220 [Rhodanobacteraceae bacterium]|jgi:hypothetical protein|nr:hypothetical protein [Rhodanobacteraceae bacterium]
MKKYAIVGLAIAIASVCGVASASAPIEPIMRSNAQSVHTMVYCFHISNDLLLCCGNMKCWTRQTQPVSQASYSTMKRSDGSLQEILPISTLSAKNLEAVNALLQK